MVGQGTRGLTGVAHEQRVPRLGSIHQPPEAQTPQVVKPDIAKKLVNRVQKDWTRHC